MSDDAPFEIHPYVLREALAEVVSRWDGETTDEVYAIADDLLEAMRVRGMRPGSEATEDVLAERARAIASRDRYVVLYHEYRDRCTGLGRRLAERDPYCNATCKFCDGYLGEPHEPECLWAEAQKLTADATIKPDTHLQDEQDSTTTTAERFWARRGPTLMGTNQHDEPHFRGPVDPIGATFDALVEAGDSPQEAAYKVQQTMREARDFADGDSVPHFIEDDGSLTPITCQKCGALYLDWTFVTTSEYHSWRCPCGASSGTRLVGGHINLFGYGA